MNKEQLPEQTAHPANNEWDDIASVPFAATTRNAIGTKAESYSKNHEFTTSNTREYFTDRTKRNYNLLKNKRPHLASVYANIVKDDPWLKSIALADTDIECNAHFSSCIEQNGQYLPQVAFNLSHIETYLEQGADTALKLMSIQLGARYEDVKSNPELVSTFILLHEFGHGTDFINNHLNPAQNTGKPLPDALKTATTENRLSRRKDLMTAPIPRHIKFTDLESQKKFSKRLDSFGLKRDAAGKFSTSAVKMAQNITYREMPSENFADSFARDYIEKHRDEYFLPAGTKDDGSGRIRTGEKIPMDEEEVILSGIRDGKNITLTKIDQAGNSVVPIGYSQTGFVRGQLEIGQSLNLVQDVTDKERKIQTSGVISVERQLLQNGKTSFTLKTDSGAIYEATRNPDIKPKQVVSSVEDMNSALELTAGSKVTLMKRNIQKGSTSNTAIGTVLYGKLNSAPRNGNEITLTDPTNGRHSNTASIEEVRRIWRSWLFKTSSGSVYEIIPEST